MAKYTCLEDDCGIKPSKQMRCASCKRHIWKTSTSLPEGEATCRQCRRGNRRRNTDNTWTWTCSNCDRQFITKNARRVCASCSRDATEQRNAAEGKRCVVVGCGRGAYVTNRMMCSGHASSAWYRDNQRNRGLDKDWITKAQRKAIYERDNYLCHLCGEVTLRDWDPANIGKCASLDHITPRSKGGTDDPSNLRVACMSCNASRQDTPIDEWRDRKKLGALTAA